MVPLPFPVYQAVLSLSTSTPCGCAPRGQIPFFERLRLGIEARDLVLRA
jgi:hypothetical protein